MEDLIELRAAIERNGGNPGAQWEQIKAGLDIDGNISESSNMSYVTLEVEIDCGHVVAKEPGRLPDKGRGLLTILHSDESGQPRLTPLQALDALQRHLGLDLEKAATWMSDVREARR